ncbi:DUF3097 family protein [uncultured Schumannella sp.]|uniref:DUF3097 family protein n=1 Tax=uncultured Schumannella sp. TaxID=1195956 RepID=UPI0025DD2185|nr:DUF3097 family protein [uncultured Schumannella sp.]
MAEFDPYGADVLAGDWRARSRVSVPRVAAERGLVVEIAPEIDPGGWVGEIVGFEKGRIALEDRAGRVRWFPLGGGYLIEGEAVVLDPPVAAPRAAARTASGARVLEPQNPNAARRARVARASRILVEGRHDAELVEKVWGSDLRAEGVVVEYLGGIDDLAAVIAERHPAPGARLGVLVDHLVPGSKESRIAETIRHPQVLIVGHPFVDVWQSIRPERLGLERWPEIPRHVEWKHGICQALGWPHADQADIAAAWQRILGSVRSYVDLEPSLLGRVEELIDFVTSPDVAAS